MDNRKTPLSCWNRYTPEAEKSFELNITSYHVFFFFVCVRGGGFILMYDFECILDTTFMRFEEFSANTLQ